MENTVNLKQLTSLERFSTDFSRQGEDYLLTRMTGQGISTALRLEQMASLDHMEDPIRIDGIAWVLCLEGSIDLEINLSPTRLSKGALAVLPPGSIIETKHLDLQGLDCYMLVVSTGFLRDINFDPNALGMGLPLGKEMRCLVMDVDDDGTAMLREYFSLLQRNSVACGDELLAKSVARCLIAALVYQLIQMARTRHKEHGRDEAATAAVPAAQRSRRSTYVSEFMHLVHEHHVRERSLQFYADRLFISAKYLSLIIKEATGRSATDIIASYVILEAKNRLRFSGKNIQQVSYELNFPNQSSFGKYFKHLTGMSPSEYQRS